MKDALLALLGARFSFLRSRRLAQMTDPAHNPALDRHRVPRRFCEQCGSDDRTPIGGIWACGRCGCTWTMP